MADGGLFDDISDVFSIPVALYKNALPRNDARPYRDRTALSWMQILRDVYYATEPNTYGNGSWGYTVLRTVYTDESEALFPVALERLKLWVVRYYVHHTRFPLWGARGQREFLRRKDGSVNEELGRRFRIESLEDKETLNMPSLENASHDDMKRLCKYFKKWVVSVGGRPETQEWNPRLYDFLVIDEPCMRSLAALPLETPPLRVPSDMLEKREWLRESDAAYLWLIDSRAVERWSGEKETEGNESSRGWVKLEAISIIEAWFQRANNMKRENYILSNGWEVTSHRVLEGTGDYWFCHTYGWTPPA